MFADPYDVILVGQSLPALIAGALLARRGHRVLLLEPDGATGAAPPVFESADLTFPKGPILFLGLHRESLYEKIFSELGLSLSLMKKEGTLFRRPVPPLQLILPSHRINFYSTWEEFLEELRREFPEEIQAAQDLAKTIQETGRTLGPFHHLPFPRWGPTLGDRSRQFLNLVQYRSTVRRLSRRTALDAVRSHGLSLELEKLLEMLGLFFYQRPLSGLSVLELVGLLNLAHQEVVEVREGWVHLAEVLVSKLKEHRGEIVRDVKLSGIVQEKGAVRGIQIEGDQIIKGRMILASLPLRLLIRPDLSRDSRPMRSYTMFFGIDEEVVPSAMMDHLLMASDLGRPLEADNFLYLHLTPPSGTEDRATKITGHRTGKRGLRVSCLQPMERPMLPSDRETLRKAVTEHLVWLMPFCEGRLDYLGEALEDSEISGRLLEFLNPAYKQKEVRRYGTRFYATSSKTLFLLPEEHQSLAATLEGAKSGWDLAQQATRWLAAK